MPTRQSTIRAPERTWTQIAELAEQFGTQTAVIIVAVDRLYQTERKEGTMNSTMDSGIYGGEDRVKQVNVLHDMAANIRFSSDDPDYPVEERVDYYIGAMRDEGELPAWFDDHDRNLLIRFASDD